MKNIFLLFTLNLLLLNSFAQDYHKIDSLKQILKTLPELDGTDADTTYIKVTIDIARQFERTKPDSALKYLFTVTDTIALINNLLNENYLADKRIRFKNIALALKMIGIQFYYRGFFYSAIHYWSFALKIYESTNDKSGMASILNALGLGNASLNNYPEPISYYTRSMTLTQDINDKAGISSCLNNLANIYVRQGYYPAALYNFKKSLLIKEQLGDLSGMADIYTNMGVVFLSQGDFKEAVNYHKKSYELYERIKNKRGIGVSLSNLGVVYRALGSVKDALKYYEQSLKTSEELGDKFSTSVRLNNIGNIYIDLEDYEKALLSFEKSMLLFEEVGNKSGQADCLNNIGMVYKSMGNEENALSFYYKALEINENLNERKSLSANHYNIGILLYNQRNYVDAKSHFEKSIEMLKEVGDNAGIATYNLYLIRTYLKLNLLNKALPVLIETLTQTNVLVQNNFSILSEKDKEMYFAKIRDVYNLYIRCMINYYDSSDILIETSYNNELLLKGLLLKSTKTILDAVYSSQDTSLINTYFLLKQYRSQISSMQGIELSNRDSLIAELENKANEQERKLVKMSSEFASIEKLFEYKWQDVQKSLKPGEAAIEFVSFTQGDKNETAVYAALIITPESKMPVSVRLFDDGELQTILGMSTGTGFDYVNSLYGKNSTALYELIWKPLEPALAGITTAYFAPVGVLNKISFAALTKEPCKMLCDIYNLQQVSTTGILISKDKAKEMKMTSAVFGGIDYNPDTVKLEAWKYLPGTMNEKNSIEKQFQKNKISCQTFSGKEAKEEKFKALFDSTDAPTILHVSTHGFFYPDPENSVRAENESEDKEIAFRGSSGFGNWMFLNNKNPMMRSGLVFSGANRVWNEEWGKTDNEGVLTAYEVSNLNMRNTDLVVLSACETGLGDIKGSEGVYGLQRAFKMAGVKYIIMSLWQVPDKETVEFMELFYKKLLKSKDIRKSFNETQKEMRKKYDPYYWAAFVLVE